MNDNKFELYKGKIHDIFVKEVFTKLLNEKNEQKTNIKDTDKFYKKADKENKENKATESIKFEDKKRKK